MSAWVDLFRYQVEWIDEKVTRLPAIAIQRGSGSERGIKLKKKKVNLGVLMSAYRLKNNHSLSTCLLKIEEKGRGEREGEMDRGR